MHTMYTPHAHHETIEATAVFPSEPQVEVNVPLTGIERLMADALIALDREPRGAMPTAGEIEYASWVRMLRRPTP